MIAAVPASVDVVSGVESRLAQEWEELADELGAEPFARPGWIRAWWAAFGRGSLEIVLVRVAGELTAVAPLCRRHGAVSSPTNWHTPLFSTLARDERAREELVQAVLGRPARWLTLAFLDATGEEVRHWREAARSARRRVLERVVLRSPYVEIDRDWAGFEATLGGKRRSELRRRRRRLEREGTLSLEVADGTQRLDALLDEGFRVEALGWKGRRSSAICSRGDTLRFYTDVAGWAASRGALRLAFLRLDGRCVAFDYCLEERARHYLVKTGYDPDFRSFGPGMLIRNEMLRRAFASSLEHYEFLGQDDAWKLDWTHAARERVRLQAFAPTTAGLAGWTALTYGAPPARGVLARLGR
jgi:CelD/BcsL family acetyltransferase involved in cellulose biosynthesis